MTKYKLMPEEPTKEMINAGIDTPCVCQTMDDQFDQPQDYIDVYQSMYASAPEAPRLTEEIIRAGFEQALIKDVWITPSQYARDDSGIYYDPSIQDRWNCWKESAKFIEKKVRGEE